MEGTNYSLADIAAATGNEGMLGGGNIFAYIILFALIFGWGGNGFGRTGEFGQYATAASQNEILLGQQFQGLDNKIDRIGNGIADATYALNNSITSEGRGIQMQLADCCCSNKEATAQVRYDMANFAAGINANTTAQTQRILDAMAQTKIDALQAEVNELKTQNMFCGVPRISPYMYGITPNCGCANT